MTLVRVDELDGGSAAVNGRSAATWAVCSQTQPHVCNKRRPLDDEMHPGAVQNPAPIVGGYVEVHCIAAGEDRPGFRYSANANAGHDRL